MHAPERRPSYRPRVLLNLPMPIPQTFINYLFPSVHAFNFQYSQILKQCGPPNLSMNGLKSTSRYHSIPNLFGVFIIQNI